MIALDLAENGLSFDFVLVDHCVCVVMRATFLSNTVRSSKGIDCLGSSLTLLHAASHFLQPMHLVLSKSTPKLSGYPVK
jgi:hypothetical protein